MLVSLLNDKLNLLIGSSSISKALVFLDEMQHFH